MTKFIEQRVDELENQVAKLELIIHELRGKKTIEPSTTNTVEDIIEFEGQQYRKVDRKAREGDVVICHSKTTTFVEKGKPYKVSDVDGHILLNRGTPDVVSLYFNERTTETVDVYEPSEEGLNPHIPIVDEMIEPLTPNQQRAEIIEKAKAFVKNIVGEYDTFNTTVGRYKDQCVRPIFHVNEKKRAITVLIYGAFGKQLIFKGLAKCNPSDVFNEHIGKAIALGRALGLDVSEFEQAVQPNEAVYGMIMERYSVKGEYREVAPNYVHSKTCTLGSDTAKYGRIINDTNTIYKEGQ